MGCPMVAALAQVPGQRCYISHSTSLQYSPLSLGPAACCCVDTLHNTPGPTPLPCWGCTVAGCWEAEPSQQPAGSQQRGEDAPFTRASSRAPEEVAGPGRVPKDLLKPAGSGGS